MNILILNWRDIKNPKSGGAEILTHFLAEEWVKSGNKVTIISSRYKGGKDKENISGVMVVRLGTWWSVHLFAFFYYTFFLRRSTDVVIDEVHWFPFFSKLYAPQKTVLLACEVARNLIFALFPKPLSFFIRGIEKLYLNIYKSVPTITISDSTKKDLVKEGFVRKNIQVIPMAVTLTHPLKSTNKNKYPTFIFLGRLNKQKGIIDVIKAFHWIRAEFPNSKLWIVGSGSISFSAHLHKVIDELYLKDSVVFWGYVSNTKKFSLLAKAHLLLVASIHEGWGLTVPEAASVGTPSIVYNVPGIVNTLSHNNTGIIVKTNTPEELAKSSVSLLNNKDLYRKMIIKCKRSVNKHTWKETADIALEFIVSKIS